MPQKPDPSTKKPIRHVPQFPQKLRPLALLPAAFLMLLGILLIPFAETNWEIGYGFTRALNIEGLLRSFMEFAVGTTIISIGIAIWTLDRPNRQAALLLMLAPLLAGISNQVIKNTTRRARPDYGLHMQRGKNEMEWVQKLIEQYPETDAKAEPGDHWLGISLRPPFFSSKYNSFGSGHTTAAFALAAGLCLLYPRLSWLWLLWAIGCGIGRVRFRQHYPTDVLFGAGFGWMVAQLVFACPFAARFTGWLTGKLDRTRFKA